MLLASLLSILFQHWLAHDMNQNRGFGQPFLPSAFFQVVTWVLYSFIASNITTLCLAIHAGLTQSIYLRPYKKETIYFFKRVLVSAIEEIKIEMAY